MRHYPFLVLCLAVAVSGCHDPKAANKDNFAKVLTAFFDKNCAMLTPTAPGIFATPNPHPFPVDIAVAPRSDDDLPRYDALAQAGLLKRGPEQTSVNYFRQWKKTVSFDLTDKGRSLWRAPNNAGSGSPGGFCAGHMRVVSVDRFTEPADLNGGRVSQVTFTLRAEYDDWTKQPALQKAFQDELGHAAPATQTFPLELMNDGWAVAMDLPQGGQQ